MIATFEVFLRRIRNHLSRTAWAIRHFQLPANATAAKEPGLVLIQIDGLSDRECRRAMMGGSMPFLQSLVEKQGYKRHALYSGLPSSTPAAQGELMYGVERIVPAFCYYDKTCGRIFSMFEGADAREIQSRLEQQGEPLLKGGSAYADAYDGGAAETNFCMTQTGWPDVLRDAPPVKLTLLTLLHVTSLARIAVLMIMELGLALWDFVRGIITKHNILRELKFVPSRVAVCIVMREILVIRSAMDLMRGLPVVHLNFLGYDEQAHRRGPDSRFAHWSLKGIDRAIHRIYNAARRSMTRDYDVWVYSDHGQVKATSYAKQAGETLAEGVSRVFDEVIDPAHVPRSGIQCQRARMLKVKRHRPETQPPQRPPIVTGLGPFGCVYLDVPVSARQRDAMAAGLVKQTPIALVCYADKPGRAVAWTDKGRFLLPDQAADVLGADHVHREATARDMVALTRHPHAGDFFIAGFRAGGPCITFPEENGSHGGVSPEETGAFALLPRDTPLPIEHAGPLRLRDIRHAAQRFLRGRQTAAPKHVTAPRTAVRTLRVMTYNIHNCGGMDGEISPHRIARVIESEQPDLVALQEVDMGRERSSAADQAALIAHYLEMCHHFHPALIVGEEQYGDAILSRFPLRIVRAAALPYRRSWLVDEPRGALWARIDIGGNHHVHVLNTHFGLWRRERRLQVEALMGAEWLQSPLCRGPIILCGDFNSTPCSAVCRRLKTRFHDVQTQLHGHKAKGTFMRLHPLRRIDHIFISSHFRVASIRVPDHHRARMASDHLPLVATLRLDP